MHDAGALTREICELHEVLMNIQSLWIGKSLSLMEKLCIRSFLACGHEFTLYVYDEVQGIPVGTKVLDANEILPCKLNSFRCFGSPSVAVFSSAFRYKLLHDRGYIWVDMDVICLRPFHISDEFCFPLTSGKFMLGRDSEYAVDSWFIKAPKQSAFLSHCFDYAIQYEGTEVSWGALGPSLVVDSVREFGLEKYVKGAPYFFPINWSKAHLFTTADFKVKLLYETFKRYSIVMHLYRDMWRRNGLDPNSAYPTGCIYETLKSRYL
jgi:hypothetical protein